jgi:glutamine phosphoribosylpyrophosphate amidotransferase
MCGVVGVHLDNVTPDTLETIKKVLIETQIRGKHASGIAWYDGDKINIYKKPLPISELLKEFDLNQIVHDNSIRMIGHIRYSTSDIEYNQPIGDDKSCLVHNGVISQSAPETWKDKYGYECNTKNDSELLYNAFKHGDNYLEKFEGCSASYLYMNEHGGIMYGRNSLRPQWRQFINNDGVIVASTKNILIRAGLTNAEQIKPDDDTELITRSMNESYSRIQNILH